MARSAGISGAAVAVAAAGALLILSGIRDAPVLDALRDIMAGRTPQGRPQVERVGVSVDPDQEGKAGRRASLARPIAGQITSGYGMRAGRMHRGVDIPAASGTPIGAAAAGKVTDTGYEPGGAGNFVKIQHEGGMLTKYFHLSRHATSRGARVTAGQTIGYVGSTGRSSGPHLHFEVWVDGKDVNPAGYIGG